MIEAFHEILGEFLRKIIAIVLLSGITFFPVVGQEAFDLRPPVEVRKKGFFGETTASLECKVQDQDLQPIPGASIRVMRKEIHWSEPRTAVSDANGKFLLAGLPLGTYDVSIEAEGFGKLIETMALVPGGFYVDFTLRRFGESLADAMAIQAGNEAFQQGLDLVDAKKFGESLPFLEKALALMTGPADRARDESVHHVEHVYAVALFECGKKDETRKDALWEQARPLFMEALSRQPEDPLALEALAVIAEYRKDGAAAARYRSAMEYPGSRGPAREYNGALAAYKAGRYAEAKDSLVDIIAKVPDFPESFYLLGLIESRQNHRAEARVAFSKYLEIAPAGAHAKRASEFLKALDPAPRSRTTHKPGTP